jgi:hypothetical protein
MNPHSDINICTDFFQGENKDKLSDEYDSYIMINGK